MMARMIGRRRQRRKAAEAGRLLLAYNLTRAMNILGVEKLAAAMRA